MRPYKFPPSAHQLARRYAALIQELGATINEELHHLGAQLDAEDQEAMRFWTAWDDHIRAMPHAPEETPQDDAPPFGAAAARAGA